jgi:hypothetical protein
MKTACSWVFSNHNTIYKTHWRDSGRTTFRNDRIQQKHHMHTQNKNHHARKPIRDLKGPVTKSKRAKSRQQTYIERKKEWEVNQCKLFQLWVTKNNNEVIISKSQADQELKNQDCSSTCISITPKWHIFSPYLACCDVSQITPLA